MPQQHPIPPKAQNNNNGDDAITVVCRCKSPTLSETMQHKYYLPLCSILQVYLNHVEWKKVIIVKLTCSEDIVSAALLLSDMASLS